MFGSIRTKAKGFCTYLEIRDYFKRFNKEVSSKDAKEFVHKITKKKEKDFFSV